MTHILHRIYLTTLSVIVLITTAYISFSGWSYYNLPIEERFFHPQYDFFKPSGFFGHSLGILGTTLIFVGVVMYILAKKYGFLTRWIRLKYLLEFHIFLCTLGPILILFHTTFKFGGIVAIAFWSMTAVVLSGVIGRYIYIQIPRSIEGRAFSREEILQKQSNLLEIIQQGLKIEKEDFTQLLKETSKSGFRKSMIRLGISQKNQKTILQLKREERLLSARLNRLETMQKLFKYWHVVHRPFALIMVFIVVIHIVVTLLLG